MKKRIMIISISAFVMVALCVSVFAAFMFNKKISGEDNTTGDIKIVSKSFYNYAYSSNDSMRVDSICKIDGIEFATTKKYETPTEEVFQSGKTYYVQNEENEYIAATDISIGSTIDKTKYYVEVISYEGISKITSVIGKDGNTLKSEIDSTKKIVVIKESNDTGANICTITCAIDSTNGLTAATIDKDGYYAVISADKTGIVVLDKSQKSNRATIEQSTNTVTCSATVNKNDTGNIYLNQLGFGFSFTNDIPVYVRIHFQDAWILTKQYSSNKKETYSMKDKISGTSPFAISDDDWYYNAAENTAYLRTIVNSSKNDADGNLIANNYEFDVNPAYFYTPSKIVAYREYMDVQVSFTVDIVQANRAYEIWGVDPSELK